ncbi:MAG: protease modulator HflC [Gammaproteobacteria bacterium]
MKHSKNVAIGAVIAILILAWASLYTVKQWERAIVFRLGEIVETNIGPGLHVMIPFVDNVRKFDARILTVEAEAERYFTVEKKNVIVDAFVKWRITDEADYYRATGGDERRAGQLLYEKINDALRNEFGRRTIQEVVSGGRAEITQKLNELVNIQAKDLGITIVDVRIKRIDLPNEVSTSVYQRMEAERGRVARDFRSRGAEAAERIRADADRQRTVTLAEAYRKAESIRGEGDAKAADIYAQAYGKNPEFYAFYRSLNAYKNTLNSRSDTLVLEPDSEFFKYFKGAGGKP